MLVYTRACVTVCARMRVLRRDILLVLVGRGGRAARSLRGVGRPLQRDAPPHLLTTNNETKTKHRRRRRCWASSTGLTRKHTRARAHTPAQLRARTVHRRKACSSGMHTMRTPIHKHAPAYTPSGAAQRVFECASDDSPSCHICTVTRVCTPPNQRPSMCHPPCRMVVANVPRCCCTGMSARA